MSRARAVTTKKKSGPRPSTQEGEGGGECTQIRPPKTAAEYPRMRICTTYFPEFSLARLGAVLLDSTAIPFGRTTKRFPLRGSRA